MHTPGLGAHYAVLLTKTSLMPFQLVCWDVPSSSGFLLVPCSKSCHFSGFHWCVVFNMVFIHFSDCSLCFTHVMGTLVQFTLILCYMGSYLFHGGVGTMAFITPCPVFHHGKTAPGGGRGSRGQFRVFIFTRLIVTCPLS